MHIYCLLPEVRTNHTNRRVPSKHKLYKHDITFGLWVILRCIYPDQKLPALRLALMEKYPGIDLSAFTGPVPNAACMAPEEHTAGKLELKVRCVEAGIESLASDESSPEDYSAQTALSNKRFLELKDLITNVTTESKRGVSDEMRKMHTETTKQIQNMHTEMIEQFTKNRKALVDIGKQVAEIRAHIELARIDRKDLDEVEARAINLEQFILSL
ncbi:hypothetical protein HZS61_002964 [Fusarium oxysporum f. sp. conglutinans]|uniref:Uncharacterized protein n=1 Tax=Fusarium oxysporum f. sp. conglutinans TaxID=100902 RepID=A0A8H6GG22_FUSOX|nr:hypothetical protein HZS61_002964 [Fusarium oxysporum f. sp. conglutinans]